MSHNEHSLRVIREFLNDGGRVKHYERGIELDLNGRLQQVECNEEDWVTEVITGILMLRDNIEKYDLDRDCVPCKDVTSHLVEVDSDGRTSRCYKCGKESRF